VFRFADQTAERPIQRPKGARTVVRCSPVLIPGGFFKAPSSQRSARDPHSCGEPDTNFGDLQVQFNWIVDEIIVEGTVIMIMGESADGKLIPGQ
jgi:hypothetical protein